MEQQFSSKRVCSLSKFDYPLTPEHDDFKEFTAEGLLDKKDPSQTKSYSVYELKT